MGTEIKINGRGLDVAAADLHGDAGTYCAFRLKSLSGVIPGAGSADHDGRLASLTAASLASFGRILASDATQVRSLGERFSAADAGAASVLRGA